MYIIINRTTNEVEARQNDWPSDRVFHLLETKNDIIVISAYSSTLKIPTERHEINGIPEWDWKEYNLPKNILADWLRPYNGK